jgi:hypothetical protein
MADGLWRQPATWLGLYGSVTATVALLINVRNWWRDRAKLVVEAKLTPINLSFPPDVWLKLRVTNHGRRTAVPASVEVEVEGDSRGKRERIRLGELQRQELAEGEEAEYSKVVYAEDRESQPRRLLKRVIVTDTLRRKWKCSRIEEAERLFAVGQIQPQARAEIGDAWLELFVVPNELRWRSAIRLSFPARTGARKFVQWNGKGRDPKQDAEQLEAVFAELRGLDCEALRALMGREEPSIALRAFSRWDGHFRGGA